MATMDQGVDASFTSNDSLMSNDVASVAPVGASLSEEVAALAALIGADEIPAEPLIGRPIHADLPTSPGWTKAIPRPMLSDLDSDFDADFDSTGWSSAPSAPVPSPTAPVTPPPPPPCGTEFGGPPTPVPDSTPDARDSGGFAEVNEIVTHEAVPVDATIPLDRLHPGDVMLAPTFAPAPVMSTRCSVDDVTTMLSIDQRLSFLDAMPVSAFLIDRAATIIHLNHSAAAMIGTSTNHLLGRSVLDYVSVDDLDFAAELLLTGGDFGTKVMGPSRIRYVDVSGRAHWTQVWAQAAPPEVGVEGFILTLTSESVRDVLVAAVTSVASDNALDHTLAAIAESARGLPLAGRGAILIVESAHGDEDRDFRLIGDWPIDERSINAPGTPWRRALTEGAVADIDDVERSDLTPAARSLLGDAGVRAVFIRPIWSEREVVGVFVVFRSDARPATINQNDHLGDALRLAGLAFAQTRRRIELENAAHRDALTGVSNRTAFNDRLRSERRAIDVLFIDLDHFKAVNDTFGHEVGDQVLAEAAQRIESTIRRDDTVYRTGGDEFVVLCEATGQDPRERITLAERIVELLLAPFDIDIHRVRIGATVGIAAAGERSLVDTVRAADTALYGAKERGRAGWAHD